MDSTLLRADADDSGDAIAPQALPCPPAAPGEFAALDYRRFKVDPPVVLAPMAGVTNQAYRRLCRGFGAGLYVSEMIIARGLVEGHAKTQQLASFHPEESPRSLQLYGSDPRWLGEATRLLVDHDAVDHLDLNFGCPVRKVTAAGGGAAIPIKPKLMARLVGAVVKNAGKVPVTVKVRLGIDDDHLSFLSSGRVAREEGCVAIGLHARTAAQLYDGQARWEAIAELKAATPGILVLGNGDIQEGQDALRMMRQTGCDGVIVGRGCLGRPWLFAELAALFAGREPEPPPDLGRVVDVLKHHVALLIELYGPRSGVLEMRKWCGWYLKGFPSSGPVRNALFRASSLEEVEALIAPLDRATPYPLTAIRARRCKKSGTQKVALPDGYLDSLDDDQAAPCAAAMEASLSPGEGG
ncbi:MAG: tRNA dihydrouridine synthase DusB [Planctomycetes bacterium]|nr:tRNA dihydrouridine synthase DusB [Planctomycetota bacterium]